MIGIIDFNTGSACLLNLIYVRHTHILFFGSYINEKLYIMIRDNNFNNASECLLNPIISGIFIFHFSTPINFSAFIHQLSNDSNDRSLN